MGTTLREIARLVGGEVVGDADTEITGVSGIKEASAGDITFLANPKYYPLLETTRASAVIAPLDLAGARIPLIRSSNPSLAFAKAVSLLQPKDLKHPVGRHPTAVVGKGAVLGRDVALGAYAVVEEGAVIGEGTVIYPSCFIGAASRIGAGCLVYPFVSVRERTQIGDRVIIHSGTVIGSDGFGYATVEGRHHKIPQVGIVVVEDDVEIGANVTIDRARFDKTVIGRGTKIDNLVQIAHNVVVGEDCIIVAQAGVSGSTTIGRGATLAGQAGIVGHITIGEGAIVAAQGGVTKDVPPHTMVSGYPAKPHELARKVNACVQNLPRLFETVKELRKKIEALEARLQGKEGR